MSSTNGAHEMSVLKSSDGETFVVEEAVALEYPEIKRKIVYNSGHVNVTSKILVKVIEYCTRHVKATSDDDLKTFDADFVNVDHGTLFNITLVAHQLGIKSLPQLIFQTLNDVLQLKTPVTIFKTIKTPEEVEADREEADRRKAESEARWKAHDEAVIKAERDAQWEVGRKAACKKLKALREALREAQRDVQREAQMEAQPEGWVDEPEGWVARLVALWAAEKAAAERVWEAEVEILCSYGHDSLY